MNPVTIAIIAAVAAAVVSESSDLYSARYTVKGGGVCHRLSYGGSYQNRKSGCSDSGK